MSRRKAKSALTHASAVLLCLAQLDLLQLLLLRALRTALPARGTLLFQLRVVPREPDVRDELMQLGQRQRAAALLRNSMEEKSVKVGCKKKKKGKQRKGFVG